MSVNNTPKIHSPRIDRNKLVHDKYKNIPKEYMKVAQGMETQFTNHLLNEMRKSAQPTNPDSNGQKIYKSLLDAERSQMMSESGTGLGIKDLVLDQIYPKHRRVPQNDSVKMYKKNINSQQGASNE